MIIIEKMEKIAKGFGVYALSIWLNLIFVTVGGEIFGGAVVIVATLFGFAWLVWTVAKKYAQALQENKK